MATLAQASAYRPRRDGEDYDFLALVPGVPLPVFRRSVEY